MNEVTMSGATYSLSLVGEERDMMGALTSWLGVDEGAVLRIAFHGLYHETKHEMEAPDQDKVASDHTRNMGLEWIYG